VTADFWDGPLGGQQVFQRMTSSPLNGQARS